MNKRVLSAAGRTLDLTRPQVMAVLNLTPDSFSDGGTLYQGNALSLDSVLRRAENVVNEGGDLFDLGGESTRPGANAVSASEECERVLPVLEALHSRFELPISIDTSNPELMVEAIKAGAFMINDVRALERPGALDAVSSADVAVCLMHMQGAPSTMQKAPSYQKVDIEVSAYLQGRALLCEHSGVSREQIVLDPGFGFGKTLAHNLSLFNSLGELSTLPYPLLVGVSRKSMIASILSRDGALRAVDQRMAGGLALATIAAMQGVSIIRTHDVQATRDAVDTVQALKSHQIERDIN
ncbi:MAG: dihydropteroate synthase [Pseudomonadales bacterium]